MPNDIEQVLDDRLELLDPQTGEPSVTGGDAVLGVRVRYCLQYRTGDDTAEHWVEYSRSGQRVPRSHRELLHAVFIDRAAPLQLRLEGAFRALAATQNHERLMTTIDAFATAVRDATTGLASSAAVAEALKAMSKQGASSALAISEQKFVDGVGFAAEDGSISGLLRAIQPLLSLDGAGSLPLSSHGSTTSSVLAITEALAASRAEHRIVAVDDFGDAMDSASADHLARMLRRPDNQVWLSTRRAEATAAFDVDDIVRLTRAAGGAALHRLSSGADRAERRRRRYLPQILAPALSARTVVFVEGPHDREGYEAVDAKLLVDEQTPPLSAYGSRLIAASSTGSDGGKSRLVDLAQVAGELGYAVRVVVDSDKPGEDDGLIADLAGICEMVVVLPRRTAVERALVTGLSATTLRAALRSLTDDHDLDVDVDRVVDADLEEILRKQLKHKGGLHQLFVGHLPPGEHPPIVCRLLDALKAEAPADSVIKLGEP